MPSDAELEQRRKAALKHGAYALRDRGEEVLVPAERVTLAELEDQLSTQPGIAQQVRRRAALALVIMSRIENYIKQELEAGKPPEKIAILGRWPMFQNATGRALQLALEVMPDERDVLDAASVLRQLRGANGDEQDG